MITIYRVSIKNNLIKTIIMNNGGIEFSIYKLINFYSIVQYFRIQSSIQFEPMILKSLYIVLFIKTLLAKFTTSPNASGFPFTGQPQIIKSSYFYIDSMININNASVIQRLDYSTSQIYTFHLSSFNSSTIQNFATYPTSTSSILLKVNNSLFLIYNNCNQQLIANNVEHFTFGQTQTTIYYSAWVGSILYFYQIDIGAGHQQLYRTSNSIEQMEYTDKRLIILQKAPNNEYKIIIYEVKPGLTPLKVHESVLGTQPIIKLTTNSKFYCIVTPTYTNIYNLQIYTQNITIPRTNISDSIPIGLNYLLVKYQGNKIDQIDITRNLVMSTQTLSDDNFTLFELYKNMLGLIRNGTLKIYQLFNIYDCTVVCASCQTWATLINSSCCVNPCTESFPPLLQFTQGPTLKYQNTSFEFRYIPPTPLPPLPAQQQQCIDCIEPSQNQQKIQQQNSEVWVSEFSRYLGNTLSLAYIPTFIKSTVPLVLFLEDIELYQYHKGIKYTPFMESCMKEVNLINTLKVNPQFINQLQIPFIIHEQQKINQLYIENIEAADMYSLQEIGIYLPFTSKQLIFPSLLLHIGNVLILLAIKYVLLKVFKKQKTLGYDFAHGFANRMKYWAILPMLVDPNLAKLIFYSWNQITTFWAYGISTKIALVVASGTIFFVIAYCLFYYIFVFIYHPKSSENLLVFSKPCIRSFMLECFVISVSKVLKSMIHGNTLQTHNSKVVCLIICNIITVVLMVKLRKCFNNKLSFIVYLLYQIAFVVLNISLLMKDSLIGLVNNSIYENIVFWVIMILISSVVVKIMLSIFQDIKTLIQYFIGRNCKIGQEQLEQQGQVVKKQGGKVEEFKHENQNKQNRVNKQNRKNKQNKQNKQNRRNKQNKQDQNKQNKQDQKNKKCKNEGIKLNLVFIDSQDNIQNINYSEQQKRKAKQLLMSLRKQNQVQHKIKPLKKNKTVKNHKNK